VSFALAKVGRPDASVGVAEPSQEGAAPAQRVEQVASQATGARSITYSVVAYLLSPPQATLVLLVIMQALAAGAISVATLGAFGRLPALRTTAALVLLAGATTVATTSMLAIPDVFAGLLIASMVLVAAIPDRLSRGVRLLCVGTAAFAVTAHISHIPLAAGLTIVGGSAILQSGAIMIVRCRFGHGFGLSLRSSLAD